MTTASHTPPPWIIRGGNVFSTNPRYYDRPIAKVGVPLDKNDSRVDEHEANCRLIACTPDLLSICQIFLGHDDRFQIAVGGNPIAVDKMLAAARAVVAKATEQ